MSIDARIVAVSVIDPGHCETCDNTGKDPVHTWDACPSCHGATKDQPVVRLLLEPREPGGSAGQSVLTVVNPPTTDVTTWSALLGKEVWGGSGDLMLGSHRWARRLSYTEIELV